MSKYILRNVFDVDIFYNILQIPIARESFLSVSTPRYLIRSKFLT